MKPERVVKRLLRKLPWFLTRSPTSLARAHAKTVGGELQAAEATTNLIKTVFARQPIRLWRDQNRPKEFAIAFDIALEDIRRVRLYRNDRKIYDSGKLGLGVNQLKHRLYLTSWRIVPQSAFLLEIEDYWGNVYEKGIPENSEIKGNAFDPNLLLDLKGKLVGCPRYRLKSVPARYFHCTYPQFHNQPLEPDYYYEERMKRYLELLNARGVLYAAIYRYLGAEPTIEGHWRLLCEQDVSHQDKKLMSTKWANSALFYVSADPDAVPCNLRRSAEELEKITQAISPSKRFVYRAPLKRKITPDHLQIAREEVSVGFLEKDAFAAEKDSLFGAVKRRTLEQIAMFDALRFTTPIGALDEFAACDLADLLAESRQTDNLKLSDSFEGRSIAKYFDLVAAADTATLCQETAFKEGIKVGDLRIARIRGAFADFFKSRDKTTIRTKGTLRDVFRSKDATTALEKGKAFDVFRSSDAARARYLTKMGDSVGLGESGRAWGWRMWTFRTDEEFKQMKLSGDIVVKGEGSGAYLTIEEIGSEGSAKYSLNGEEIWSDRLGVIRVFCDARGACEILFRVWKNGDKILSFVLQHALNIFDCNDVSVKKDDRFEIELAAYNAGDEPIIHFLDHYVEKEIEKF